MKILIVVPSYEPAWRMGGVVTCMSNLGRGLAANGEDITVYTTNYTGSGEMLDSQNRVPVEVGGVKVNYFEPTTTSLGNFDSIQLTRALTKNIGQFDIVYVTAVWQMIGLHASRVCHSRQIPYVIGLHGSFDRRLRAHSAFKKKLFRFLFLKQQLHHAAALHLTSQMERDESLDWIKGCASFIVPNSVDPSRFYPLSDVREAVRRELNIPLDSKVIITVGRPDPKKRIDLILQAIHPLNEIYLVVVGPNEMGAALDWKRIAVELQLEGRVRWTGYQSGGRLLRFLSAADLFILPSEDENFGMVVVEAMMCGLPVLVSEHVGVWEWLKNLCVGESFKLQPQAVSKAIQQALKKVDRTEYNRIDIRHKAVDLFAPCGVAKQMSIALSDILNGDRSKVCNWQG